jgi:hypothetical protein
VLGNPGKTLALVYEILHQLLTTTRTTTTATTTRLAAFGDQFLVQKLNIPKNFER